MKITRMKRTTLNTPLGTAEIIGDDTGISRITILEEDHLPREEVPQELKKAVEQLELYFEGKLTAFNLEINPAGTEFQKKYGKLFVKSHLEKPPLICNSPKNWGILRL